MFFSIVEFLYFSKLKMVADDIILSAAHCYEAFDDVDLGRHNIKDPDDDFERYNVETFVTHPNYVEQGNLSRFMVGQRKMLLSRMTIHLKRIMDKIFL